MKNLIIVVLLVAMVAGCPRCHESSDKQDPPIIHREYNESIFDPPNNQWPSIIATEGDASYKIVYADSGLADTKSFDIYCEIISDADLSGVVTLSVDCGTIGAARKSYSILLSQAMKEQRVVNNKLITKYLIQDCFASSPLNAPNNLPMSLGKHDVAIRLSKIHIQDKTVIINRIVSIEVINPWSRNRK